MRDKEDLTVWKDFAVKPTSRLTSILLGLSRITVDGEVVPCSTIEWGLCMEDIKLRRVGRTEVGKHIVSTVFTGVPWTSSHDHTHYFESVVFARGDLHGEADLQEVGYRRTYATLDEARAGHKDIVSQYRERLKKVVDLHRATPR